MQKSMLGGILPLLFLFNACAVQHRIDCNGVVQDDQRTYLNDSMGIDLLLGHYHAQYGFIPIDREASRLLSYCEIDPGKDIILFAGTGFFCVERYSVPSYLNEEWDEHELPYQKIFLLDEADNYWANYEEERHFLFQNPTLFRNFPRETIDSLKKIVITRNVRAWPRKEMTITEDLIPYKDHYISMIYIDRRYNRRFDYHSWRGGNTFYDPTSPNRMRIRQAGWKYDFDLRLTRENGMRLILNADSTSLRPVPAKINP